MSRPRNDACHMMSRPRNDACRMMSRPRNDGRHIIARPLNDGRCMVCHTLRGGSIGPRGRFVTGGTSAMCRPRGSPAPLFVGPAPGTPASLPAQGLAGATLCGGPPPHPRWVDLAPQTPQRPTPGWGACCRWSACGRAGRAEWWLRWLAAAFQTWLPGGAAAFQTGWRRRLVAPFKGGGGWMDW